MTPLLKLRCLAAVAVLALATSAPVAGAGYELDLGGGRFDPLVDPAPGPYSWHDAVAGPDLQLVQFHGPTRQSWLDALATADLEIVQYIHPFTYVVWGDLERLGELRAKESSIRWAGHFEPAFRVLPQWRGGKGHRVYHALLYSGADLELATARLESLGARFRGGAPLDHRFVALRLELDPALMLSAARVPGVYTIQPEPLDGGPRSEMSSQVNVNNVDVSNFAFPGYQNWLTGVGLDGAGVIIANVDGGVQENHPDLAARFLSCTGDTCSTTSSSHGTHTAGIMAADGSSGVNDGYGFRRGLGVAPGANLIEQRYSGQYNLPDGMLKLMRQSWQNGALLSGNSWGPSGTPRGYDNHTMQVDIGVRDADNTVAGNQQLTYVLSFMNGNGGTSSQGTPDEGKNLFTIGSTKLQLSSGAQDPAIDDLSSNTAHGPALDGRTIPHMVAPGCRIDSTYPTNTHALLCGTSMASPQVSGAVALFIERHRSLFGGANPTPALVKAAFLPVAHDLAGHRDADNGILGHPFDSKQGWGRMDLEAVLDPVDLALYFDAPQVLGNTGEEWMRQIVVVDPTRPLRVMLVWTDAPGHGLGGSTPAWNNDLDLLVEDGAASYRGNRFGATGYSVTGGSFDGRNNTEGVFLPPGPERALTVRVRAANINSDGVPGVGDGTDQDFALVCYNCSDSPRVMDGGTSTGALALGKRAR
jgi:hypothetical protein